MALSLLCYDTAERDYMYSILFATYLFGSILAIILFFVSEMMRTTRLKQIIFVLSFSLAALTMLAYAGAIFTFKSQRLLEDYVALAGIVVCTGLFVSAQMVRGFGGLSGVLVYVGWAVFFLIFLPTYRQLLELMGFRFP